MLRWVVFLALAALAAAADSSGYYLNANTAGYREYAFYPRNATGVLSTDLMMNTTGAFTFEAWVYYAPSGATAEKLIVELTTGNVSALATCGALASPNDTYAWRLYLDSTDDSLWVELAACLNGTDAPLMLELGSLQAMPRNAWTHVSAQFASGDGVYLYTNGTLENRLEAPEWDTSATPMLTTGTLLLFDSFGSVDEVRWWDLLRGPSLTRRDYCTRLNGNNRDLLAYWDFDRGADESAIIYDRSPSGNELYNAPPVDPTAFVAGQPPMCSTSNESSTVIALIIILVLLFVAAAAVVFFFLILDCRSRPSPRTTEP